jgi:malonate-semialdehyde dehydrogenase (acetylating)/methylmalonate-semialdehyde dehydrogenase
LCKHPAIKAVSFVGSGHVGKIVHSLASATGKRVQCNMGAKNHAVVLPDANAEQVTSSSLAQNQMFPSLECLSKPLLRMPILIPPCLRPSAL